MSQLLYLLLGVGIAGILLIGFVIGAWIDRARFSGPVLLLRGSAYRHDRRTGAH